MEAVTRAWPVSAVELEATKIVGQMAHNLSLTSVRGVGYALTKILHVSRTLGPRSVQSLYSNIYTNSARWAQIRTLSATNPIVFMPTHKSYMDFLLVSYLCFAHEVPLPAIAAAMDFLGGINKAQTCSCLGSKFIGKLLRQCGAFFIRRAAGDDKLYWAIFTEYVQTHLKNNDHPMEFFLEGTRSRTGKTMHPKYGLLTAILEPFFR